MPEAHGAQDYGGNTRPAETAACMVWAAAGCDLSLDGTGASVVHDLDDGHAAGSVPDQCAGDLAAGPDILSGRDRPGQARVLASPRELRSPRQANWFTASHNVLLLASCGYRSVRQWVLVPQVLQCLVQSRGPAALVVIEAVHVVGHILRLLSRQAVVLAQGGVQLGAGLVATVQPGGDVGHDVTPVFDRNTRDHAGPFRANKRLHAIGSFVAEA